MYPGKSKVYTGLEASKAVLLEKLGPDLREYGKVVFATHGFLGTDFRGSPNPVLVLSLVPQGTDGYLSINDIMGLRMRAEIVALTACNTGMGKHVSGEGIMGMGRAFQNSGARSVLMTLWSVSESQSIDLTRSFFESLRKGKNKLDALQTARAIVRKSGFDHPFFWAGFILVGEAD
jgi:CHAT domain-containing protein